MEANTEAWDMVTGVEVEPWPTDKGAKTEPSDRDTNIEDSDWSYYIFFMMQKSRIK